MLDRKPQQSSAITGFRFSQQRTHIFFHRARTQVKPIANLGIRKTFRQ
jgi:hypothetical protein